MSKPMEDLIKKVEAVTDVKASVAALTQGIGAQVVAAKNDPVALQALADELNSTATQQGTAVLANVPVK